MEEQAPKCSSCNNPSYIACSACGHRTLLVFQTVLPAKGYEKHYKKPPQRCPHSKSDLSVGALFAQLPQKKGKGSHGNSQARFDCLRGIGWVELHPCQCILRRMNPGSSSTICPRLTPSVTEPPSFPLATSFSPYGLHHVQPCMAATVPSLTTHQSSIAEYVHPFNTTPSSRT